MKAPGAPVVLVLLKTVKPRGHSDTAGWQPTCGCNAAVVPATVLDPCCSSGATGAVALRHGRDFIGIEINPKYVRMAQKRIQGNNPLLDKEANNEAPQGTGKPSAAG